MTEHSEALRATLQELHEQLESVEAGDPEVRALLRGALDELQSTLEASPKEKQPQPEEDTLAERFEEAAAHFEESHPVLAGTLRNLIDTLSQMGI
jgi:hypothetical protein